MQVHRMKAFSFFRSSLAGGCYQGPCKPEETNSGFIPKVPSLLFDLEVTIETHLLRSNCQICTSTCSSDHFCLLNFFLLQLEDGTPAFAEKQEDAGAPTVAAHIRSLTEPRSEEECQASSCLRIPMLLLLYYPDLYA